MRSKNHRWVTQAGVAAALFVSIASYGQTVIKAAGEVQLVWDWEVYHDPNPTTFSNAAGGLGLCTFDNPIHFYRDSSQNLFTVAAAGTNYKVPFLSDFTPARALVITDVIFESAKSKTKSGTYGTVSPQNISVLYHQGYSNNTSGPLVQAGSCVEANYDNRSWIFGMWSNNGLNFSALTHHEYYPSGFWGGGTLFKDCKDDGTHPEVSSVGFMTSATGAQSFLPLPYAPYEITGLSNSQRNIMTPQAWNDAWGEWTDYGFFHPSNIVQEGLYYYALVGIGVRDGNFVFDSATQNDPAHWTSTINAGFAMVRTTNPLQATTWQVYTDAGWADIVKSTYQGGSGQAVKMFLTQYAQSPYSVPPSGGENMTYTLTKITPNGKWLASGISYQGSPPAYSYSVAYAQSTSLAAPGWEPGGIDPQWYWPILTDGNVSGFVRLTAGMYPSLVDPTASGYTPQEIGVSPSIASPNQPYLYFVAENGSAVFGANGGMSVILGALVSSGFPSKSIWRIPLSVVTDGSVVDIHGSKAEYSSVQGGNSWKYLDSSGGELAYDSADGIWKSGSQAFLWVWNTGGHPGPNSLDSVRRWSAPRTGVIRITGNAHDTDGACGDGVIVSIRKNSSLLWTKAIANANAVGYYFDVTTSVAVNDSIDFVINKNTNQSCDSTYFSSVIALK